MQKIASSGKNLMQLFLIEYRWNIASQRDALDSSELKAIQLQLSGGKREPKQRDSQQRRSSFFFLLKKDKKKRISNSSVHQTLVVLTHVQRDMFSSLLIHAR